MSTKTKSTRRDLDAVITPTKAGRSRRWLATAPRSKLFAKILSAKRVRLAALIKFGESELKLKAADVRAAVSKMALDGCIRISAVTLLLAATLAAGRVEAQTTYDLDVNMLSATGAAMSFGGSFVYDAGELEDVNVGGGPVAFTVAGGGGEDWTLWSCLPSIGCDAPQAVQFETSAPLGTAGPVTLEAFQYEYGNSVFFCAPTLLPPGRLANEQETCAPEALTVAPTRAPELDAEKAFAALTLLAGLTLIARAQGTRP